MSLFTASFLASLIASLGTGLGALGVYWIPVISTRQRNIMLSTAAGVMLAATIFSLLIPSLDATSHASITVGGLFLGAILMGVLHWLMPHEHLDRCTQSSSCEPVNVGEAEHYHRSRTELNWWSMFGAAERRIWLFVLAIALHNLPEGMSVAIGFAAGNTLNGQSMALGIFLQNIPEGFAISVALISIGLSRRNAFFISFSTGFIEAAGGLLGAALITYSTAVLPWVLAAAAGAMLFVISDEIIPETHREGYEKYATYSLLAGFSAMILLNQWLGI